MIDRKWEPTFTFEGNRNYIFIMDCVDEDGERYQHFFLFDEVGGCAESRYFCHPHYMKQIEETLLLTHYTGHRRQVWVLVPHGKPSLPDPNYAPSMQQVELDPESAEPYLCFDKLYAREIIAQDALLEATDA